MATNETKDYVCLEGSTPHIDFDGLYRNVSDPWGAVEDSCGSYRVKCERLCSAIVDQGIQSYAEIGCGGGHWLRHLSAAVDMHNCRVEGYDLSPVAVDLCGGQDAAVGLGAVACSVHDILRGPLDTTFDAICLDGLLWYVVNDIGTALQNALESAPRC